MPKKRAVTVSTEKKLRQASGDTTPQKHRKAAPDNTAQKQENAPRQLSQEMQAGMDHFVKTMGHLILMKVNPEATRGRVKPN
jgi:hypothetical protein